MSVRPFPNNRKMNYKLTAKLLAKYNDDAIKQLIAEYCQVDANYKAYVRIAEEQAQQIKILKAENQFLKEDLDAI